MYRDDGEHLVDPMNLFYPTGWICDPVSKARSVLLTGEGEDLARRFLRKHFARGRPGDAALQSR